MSPGGHLVTTAITCAGVYAGTGSIGLTAGLAAGGFLIDVDHLLDYVVFERQRAWRPSAFLRHYLEGRMRLVVLPLHSYELLALLAALAWFTNSEWVWGYVLGMALHLPLDIVFNGRLVPGGLWHFYSFAVRARAGFKADRFALPACPAPPGERFLTAFFRTPGVDAVARDAALGARRSPPPGVGDPARS